MKTGGLTTGWKTGESEFLAHAVVQNVTGFAETRNEIYRSASLAQNAHVDWHSRLSHRGRVFTPRQLGVFLEQVALHYAANLRNPRLASSPSCVERMRGKRLLSKVRS